MEKKFVICEVECLNTELGGSALLVKAGGKRFWVPSSLLIDADRVICDEIIEGPGVRYIKIAPAPKPPDYVYKVGGIWDAVHEPEDDMPRCSWTMMNEWTEWKHEMEDNLRNCANWNHLVEEIIGTFDKMPRCRCGKGK